MHPGRRCSAVLTADLLQKYGLPEDQVLDAVELAVTRTLSAAFDTTISVRAENGLEIVGKVIGIYRQLE